MSTIGRNMKKYAGNVKKYVENMKKFVEIRRYTPFYR